MGPAGLPYQRRGIAAPQKFPRRCTRLNAELCRNVAMEWGVSVRCCLVIAALGLALSGCATPGQSPGMASADPTPEKPGTRIAIRNPNNSKWMAVQQPGQPKSPNAQMWLCRPLACASGQAAVGA
jgi:hypothetical protein